MTFAKLRDSLLLRGSAAIVLMLLIWQLALVKPALFLLRYSTQFAVRVLLNGDFIPATETADWTFRLPVEVPGRDLSPKGAASGVYLMDAIVPASALNPCTFGMPLLWALLLASPGLRRAPRPFLVGTLLLGGLEVLSCLILAEIALHNRLAVMDPQLAGGFRVWMMSVGSYISNLTIPFAAPFLLAIALHADLRREVLLWVADDPLPLRSRNKRGSR